MTPPSNGIRPFGVRPKSKIMRAKAQSRQYHIRWGCIFLVQGKFLFWIAKTAEMKSTSQAFSWRFFLLKSD